MDVDFEQFKRSLPYASELYGVYQPLLGWRSELQKTALAAGVSRTRAAQLNIALQRYQPKVTGRLPLVARAQAASAGRNPLLLSGTVVGRKIFEAVTAAGSEDPAAWKKFTAPGEIDRLLRDNKDEILQSASDYAASVTPDDPQARQAATLAALGRESQLAGLVADMHKANDTATLMEFFKPVTVATVIGPSLASLIPTGAGDVAHGVISPIGVVHLFRQYFFEFETFLGPPVQHLWLSPGGTVELVETSTRRVLMERDIESAYETTDKSESTTTTQDELSDAIRAENQSDTKVGISVSSNNAYDLGIIKGSVNPSASFNIDQTAKASREQTHKSLRQQTDKVSSEIRKSFKSTFKVVTETSDTQSRRHVITNTTAKLVNYELRRKMRQVGVQVQDFGAQLCWQAYVDQPGKELGLSELVHISTPMDLQCTPEPEAAVMPEGEIRAAPLTLSLQWRSPNDRRSGFIPLQPKIAVVPPKPGYIFARAEVVIVSGPAWNIRPFPQNAAEESIRFEHRNTPDPAEVDLIPTDVAGQTERSVRFVLVGHDAVVPIQDDTPYDWSVQLTLIFKPSRKLIADVTAAHDKKLADFQADKDRQLKEAYFSAARDRIAEASNLKPRPFADLREEERIIVFRNLVRDLLKVAGITNEDPKVRHVFAELVQSMFDVDRMLYFVAPEWWLPRRTNGAGLGDQLLGIPEADRAEFSSQQTVSWGGIAERPDNYYVTDDAQPAPLGSSLGWILQLDGDNLRNAFINAPWVKAVVPIRPGREWDALRWLQSATIEGSDGLDETYRSDDPAEKPKILAALKTYAWKDPFWTNHYAAMADANAITVLDAIHYLILRLQEIDQTSRKAIPDPNNPAVSALPTDQVYEFGFDPLQGGFTAAGKGDFQVFDQWIEILPTDQIVPVEVEYDPKTGQLK